MPNLSPDQIAYIVATNDEPHEEDGICNAERLACVLNVFGRANISLAAEFPFADVMECRDQAKVQAAIYLAKLQHQFVAMCTADHHFSAAEGDLRTAWLHLWALKMAWHLKHLKKNEATPPFPFIQ